MGHGQKAIPAWRVMIYLKLRLRSPTQEVLYERDLETGVAFELLVKRSRPRADRSIGVTR